MRARVLNVGYNVGGWADYFNPDAVWVNRVAHMFLARARGGLVGVPRRTSKIYLSLLEDGYTDEEIPPWFLRPVEEKLRKAQRSSEAGEHAQEQLDLLTPRLKGTRTTRPLGQGVPESPGAELAPVSDSEVPGGPPSFTEEELAVLQAQRVVWIPAEARWMKVEDTSGGGYSMTPADPRSYLAPGEDDALPSMPEISAMMIEELKIKTSAIMKKVARAPNLDNGTITFTD